MKYSAVLSLLAVAAVSALIGCNLAGPNRAHDSDLEHFRQLATKVEYADALTPPSLDPATVSAAPRTIRNNSVPQEFWEMSLAEAIQTSVSRSPVLRDLGGTVVRAPDVTRTILGPSISASDPQIGMEAALSDFDAILSTSVIGEKNDRMLNNFVASGGTRIFQQDLVNFRSEITKKAVAGTQMTLRGNSIYDANNAAFNRFPSAWDSIIDFEVRQPLLQGAGTPFNRLAGPNARPGLINGVLVARVNADISVADFELGLRDLVSNVENAYWDLYFSYRDLDGKVKARNASLETWRRINAMLAAGQPGGTAEREAQAREQYYRFEEDVQNSLSGRLQEFTTTNNGSGGGSFRGTGGVLVCERRLRLAIGIPITDARMIRPLDEPTLAGVRFDWNELTCDALALRPELTRQRLLVKRREMELVANRNFLLPKFDLVGRYRYRGLGNKLAGDVNIPPDPADPENHFSQGSLDNLFGGDFQEWQFGGEITMPIGFRRAYASVRNSQLLLARDKAVLQEQERQIIHDLSNALAELDRSYAIMQTAYNRRIAAETTVRILRDKLMNDLPINLDQLLEAERRLAESDIQFHRAMVEHMLAIKNVHFERGTLLGYSNVQLAEKLDSRPNVGYLASPQAPPEMVESPAVGPGPDAMQQVPSPQEQLTLPPQPQPDMLPQPGAVPQPDNLPPPQPAPLELPQPDAQSLNQNGALPFPATMSGASNVNYAQVAYNASPAAIPVSSPPVAQAPLSAAQYANPPAPPPNVPFGSDPHLIRLPAAQ